MFNKMRKIIISEEQELMIVQQYTINKKSSKELSLLFNVPIQRILNLLKENNITRNSGQQYKGGKTESDKRYYQNNKETLSEYYSQWYEQNKEARKNYIQKWRSVNKEIIRNTKRTYEKTRKQNDPLYKLIGNFRTAIYTVLKEKNITKCEHYFDILGYSQQDLINHLEKQFTDGITWENYGEWHVDHKLPITFFKFQSMNDNDFKKCWALDNLQPMWGSENISKSSKILTEYL